MNCGIKMWIKCKQKPVKVPANWCEKTNRMWAWVCSLYPNEHVYAKKNPLHLHPPNVEDWCVLRFPAVSARAWNPYPLTSPKTRTNHENPPEINVTSSMQSIWGCTGEGGGCIWTDLFKSTTADALSGFHMRTDDLHPTRKCSQNRCGNMDVPRSEERGALTWA